MGIKQIGKAIKDFFCPKDLKGSFLQGQLEGQQMVLDLMDKVNKGMDKTFKEKKRR